MDGRDLGLLARVFLFAVKGIGKLIKLAIFTGLIWFCLPICLGLLVEIVSGQPFHPNYTNPVLYFLIDKVLWYAGNEPDHRGTAHNQAGRICVFERCGLRVPDRVQAIAESQLLRR